MANIISECDFLDTEKSPVRGIHYQPKLSMREIIAELGYALSIEEPSEVDGFIPATEDWLDRANLFTLGIDAFTDIEVSTEDPPEDAYWMETQYLSDKKDCLAVFPNEGSARERIMLYAPSVTSDGRDILEVVSAELYGQSEDDPRWIGGIYILASGCCRPSPTAPGCESLTPGHKCNPQRSRNRPKGGPTLICRCPICSR